MGLEILESGSRSLRIDPARTEFPYKITHPFPQGGLTVERVGKNFTVTPSQSLQEANVQIAQ
ncbi:MAG: hypothetical protein ACLFVC_04315 [Opitutales bacterium]